MKKLVLLFIILVGLSLSSCTSNNESPAIGSLVGTYNLISIESNKNLDPSVSGNFNDKEIIDNISCLSTMTINSNGVINLEYVNFSQTLVNNAGVITYSSIQCEQNENISGQYIANFDGITFTFDPSIEVTTTFIFENLIKIRMNKLLVTNTSGILQLEPVEVTYVYQKQ